METNRKPGYSRLVLTRKMGTSIIVKMPDGRDIIITPVKQRACGTQIAITCPEDVKVDREEVIHRDKDRPRAAGPLRCPCCKGIEVAIARDMNSTRQCVACKHVWLPAEDL